MRPEPPEDVPPGDQAGAQPGAQAGVHGGAPGDLQPEADQPGGAAHATEDGVVPGRN